MSDRDELAETLFFTTDGLYRDDSDRAADAVWAAGWRKKPSREDLMNAMIGSDAIAGDTRAEAMVDGSTQREPFLMFADAILELLDGPTETGEK